MNADLRIIKKKYGEEMSHLCRELFPVILEQEGLLSKLLLDNFEPSHFLYEDIVKNNLINGFKNFIYDQINVKKEKFKEESTKTPQELLSETGYDLYECHSESDIQKFKKYYASGEELCTFNGGRLNSCYVFFAVKKNVDKIIRSDFNHPNRQDKYGTSVVSIQFTRDCAHTLSIKNRYNHTVGNPDATFSNNLDNITPGLTDSFSKYYGLEQKNKNSSLEIPSYVRANDGKYYAYNLEVDNVYYCPNNIVIKNFKVHRYNKNDVLLFDKFLMNCKTKEIVQLDGNEDGFLELCSNVEKIEVLKDGKNKIIRIYDQKAGLTEIELNNKNAIIKLKNEQVKQIGNKFLYHNRTLQDIILSNVAEIGNHFLYNNDNLLKLTLPEVKVIGSLFCGDNVNLEKIELPKAEYIGSLFLYRNLRLKKICLPKAKYIDIEFLSLNRGLEEIILPNVEIIGDYFCSCNAELKEISFPNVREIGDFFLEKNRFLTKIDLPNVIKVGSCFLHSNNLLEEVSLPRLEVIRSGFLRNNKSLKMLNLPFAKYIDDSFLYQNRRLKKIILPNVEIIGYCFLDHNEKLKEISFPNARKIGDYFLSQNQILNKIDLPNVINVGAHFLYSNNSLKKVFLPGYLSNI